MSEHIPVLLDEVMEALTPKPGAIYVDGTFGGGGYARALLERADCKVYAMDRDPDAIARGQRMAKRYDGRLTLTQGVFSEMDAMLAEFGVAGTDGVALDLGVSSFQFDEAARGFSFRDSGPLDMRMAREGRSAADVVNETEEAELANILWRYGEEKRSRAVARAIVAARPLNDTRALAAVVERALGPAARKQAIHPATRTFQALRIYVNDELGELERGLEAAERSLNPQGRLAVVSFHSLEDRIVKRFLAERSGRAGQASRHAPAKAERAPSFRLIDTNGRTPSAAEIEKNPRSRSARLRTAERTQAPAFVPGSAAQGGHA
jgi:16S rRNA (cytosine1402-N4)-methyltransferase